MGRGRKFRHDRKRPKEDKWNENAPRKSYESIVRENANFETYYKLQKIVPENEWEHFMSTMKENLPTAFRITGSKSESRVLLRIIQSEFFKGFLNPSDLQEGDKKDDKNAKESNVVEKKLQPFCLPWYPDNLAWQLQLTREDIRRSEMYFRLHNFLISETGCGNISRQEVVSMIPPLLLGVEPHHKVLDMCAAPGSKTAQLIELLHAEDGTLPSGFVVANDIDNNRCYVLVHQAKRLNSPCIVITNHDSAVLPNFTIKNGEGKDEILKFDRVLCDVPCSGDGTLRKNPDIWVKWNAAGGNYLHSIQLRILRRGLEMLKVGGLLVYSTCSLNPIENEAVIHRMLVESVGAVHLVEASTKLPGLKHSNGMSHWLPASRDLVGYTCYEEVPAKWHTQVWPQMFPPAAEIADQFNLQRCMRILPHYHNTGGFFVAVLKKISPLPWEAAARVSLKTSEDQSSVKGSNLEQGNGLSEELKLPREPQRKKRRIYGYREDPFVFFNEDEPLWPVIRDFYNINNQLQPTCLLTRCKEGKKKNIYFVSPAVRDLIVSNCDKIKLINAGVKTFVRCDNKTTGCPFRLAQEGLRSIFPYIGPKRKVTVTKSDLIALLTNNSPKQSPELSSLSQGMQDQLKDVEQGSCVLVYEEQASGDDSLPLTLQMVGWRGMRLVRPYVAVNDCVHYLRLCGADVSKFEVNKFKEKSQSEESTEKDADNKTIETSEDIDDISEGQSIDQEIPIDTETFQEDNFDQESEQQGEECSTYGDKM